MVYLLGQSDFELGRDFCAAAACLIFDHQEALAIGGDVVVGRDISKEL